MKNKIISIRLTEEEFQKLKQDTSSISETVRNSLEFPIKAENKKDININNQELIIFQNQIIKNIKYISININQVSIILNKNRNKLNDNIAKYVFSILKQYEENIEKIKKDNEIIINKLKE